MKIKFQKIKEFFQRIAERSFLTILVFFLISLIFGGIIFYKYFLLAKKLEPKIEEKPLFFKEEFYQKILKIWQDRQEKFDQTEFKEYPDPFQILTD